MPYEKLCSYVQGASHIKAGTPREDYGICDSRDGMFVFVTADGHGDSNCPRSSYGAKTVCRIASKNLLDFGSSIQKAGWEHKMFPQNAYDQVELNKLIHQLIVSIVAEWTEAVNDDINQNPLTKEEKDNCIKYLDRYERGERLEHIYGTTMIAGLSTNKYLLLLQQGDGRCVIFDHNGIASQPIPWDNRCFLNITTSMCDLDVIDSMRYSIVDQRQDSAAAVMACSDGIEDTFYSMEQMYVYLRSLLVYAVDNGVPALEKHLNETLPDFSARGSQDDCTITGIIDSQKIMALTDVFDRDNKATVIRSKINKLHEQVDKEMPPKLEYLKRRAEDAQQRYSAMLERENELAILLKQIDIELNDTEKQIQNSPESEEQLKCEELNEDSSTSSNDAGLIVESYPEEDNDGENSFPWDDEREEPSGSDFNKSNSSTLIRNLLSVLKDEFVWGATIKLRNLISDKEKLQQEYEDPNRRQEMEKCKSIICEYEEYKRRYDEMCRQLAELEALSQ